ncbi:MAG TPA: SPOR domain-containing protein [Pseudoxanthomonas sp.]|nr:SPOR domain-containing protein [Pseudoxanthomonas sp.]
MDTALKQRLIGAVVLVALAVIFLPMLVKGPAPDSGVSDVPLKVPDAPDGQFETRELPLVTPGDAPAGGAVGLPTNTAPNPDAAALAKPAGADALDAATAGGNYAVSFGAYASPADADAVVARLKQAKLPGYSETATINGRTAYRVRIGPYADQATAESMRLEAVKVRNDVNAKVVVLDAAAATAPTPSVAQAAAPSSGVTTEALPPEPAKPAATPAPAANTAASSKPTTPPPAPAAKPSESPKPAAAAPKPAATVAAPSAPAASNVGFAVQLGAFAKPEDANALRDKVRAGGYSAFVEQVRTDKGTLSRVRVGPVASRAEADTLKAQVASKFGINGMVRPHP